MNRRGVVLFESLCTGTIDYTFPKSISPFVFRCLHLSNQTLLSTETMSLKLLLIEWLSGLHKQKMALLKPIYKSLELFDISAQKHAECARAPQ